SGRCPMSRGPSVGPALTRDSYGHTIRWLDYSPERLAMVADLRRMGIRDERVLAAMAKVPRELFVRLEDQDVAYGDHALGIPEGQTISQPFVVARMTEQLQVEPTHHVLEVGTDRKSTRLNSSHLGISYAVFCLK